jgi:hypothetical protein
MIDVRRPDPRMAGEFAMDRLELVVIREQTFREQDVWLDGRSFVDCHFIGSTLHVEYGRFGIFETGPTTGSIGGCSFVWHGPAKVIATLLEVLAAGNARIDEAQA